MAPDNKSPRSWRTTIAMVVAVAILATAATAAEPWPSLVVQVGDTTAPVGATSTVSVFLDNYSDTIAGFNLWLQLDRQDLMLYETNVDTVIDTLRFFCENWEADSCTDSLLVAGDTLFFQCNEWDAGLEYCLDSTLIPYDSIIYAGWDYDFFYEAQWDFAYIDTIEQLIGTFDTTGTLISGWEWVDARSLSSSGADLNVAGIADLPGGAITPGILPQQGGVLVKLQSQVHDSIPDTLLDRTVNVMIQSNFLGHFNFARPDGSSIGLEYVEIPDTNCYICTAWAGDICLNWKRVSLPPPGGCDSTHVGVDTLTRVDTSLVWLYDGSLTVLGTVCGDVNGDGSETPDISDLVYLVSYMFAGGPAPVQMWTADVDCSGSENPDISDLVYLVSYMFSGGPWCGCQP